MRFGTSGLRGLVTEMTDREVYLNTRGFLDYLRGDGDLVPGDPVALGQDLRETDPVSGLSSSPRIAATVALAIEDAGFVVVNCGKVPTPALAHYALYPHARNGRTGAMPAIMVTGSHIPADRNGIKFYRRRGEILKADEPGILACVDTVRNAHDARGPFDSRGMLRTPPILPAAVMAAANAYVQRFADLFPDERPLAGRRVISYEHSAVGRDLTGRILEALGAEVTPVDRSERFVSVDTEDLSASMRTRLAEHVAHHRAFALVSTDGDGDRPVLVDEKGRFHPGDVLGLVAADFLGACFAAVPVSSTDAIERWAEGLDAEAGVPRMIVTRTRIGSPYVIEALNEAVEGGTSAALGWEANGGLLTATDFELNGRVLKALPTRDAVLPLLAALLLASSREIAVSELFAALPKRATSAGLIDDFPAETSRALIERLSPSDPGVVEVKFDEAGLSLVRRGDTAKLAAAASDDRVGDYLALRDRLGGFFTDSAYGRIVRVNFLDGVRISFASGDVVHLRPSGNAPQLRVYALADDQSRADQIVEDAVRDPGGLIQRMARDLIR